MNGIADVPQEDTYQSVVTEPVARVNGQHARGRITVADVRRCAGMGGRSFSEKGLP
jgi:hypothetical protein